ncbi:hypothetical protein FB45DRAFT_39745 [Roridomyces roridus]|uniref:Uncharacterized protein n=1 Tax=Roridomyces roridus TaxID=1738132 RepID=A0AAD7BRF0_9AGAR|nr:hypothetical protein FB45DRAFT_39745 [Roridomyces roridus]
MPAFWRRKDDSPAPRGRIDKAAIGNPVLKVIPRRFEIYADNYTRAPTPVARSFSRRSDSSGGLPPKYPLIRSYSLPTPAAADDSVSAPAITSRANSCSAPLHLDIPSRPLSPIREQSCVSPMSPLSLRTPSEENARQTSSKIPDTPPTIPELKLGPYFPGPHPSQEGDGPPRRPPKALMMPTSLRSSVYHSGGATSSTGSLHAESFVTARSTSHPILDLEPIPFVDVDPEAPRSGSTASSTLPVSQSETGGARLERRGTAASCATTTTSLRLKRLAPCERGITPAFCAFWLGFLFPPAWWVGGWYFTFFAETPAGRTLWEHYVGRTRWWGVVTCGRRGKTKQSQTQNGPKLLLLPRWVGANNISPSLSGISYYYPFVSRPPGHVSTSPPPFGFRRLHALFDELTRSKLERVKRERESARRIIDPWIQRCRRALCYWLSACLLFVLGMIGWSFAVGAGKSRY